MSTVAVIGERALIQGYALAGARVLVAETARDVRDQWAQMPRDVLVVILTSTAAAGLPGIRSAPDGPMTVVMPA
jgi:vacuolar-type H+-ATPase subunit F/Vma7